MLLLPRPAADFAWMADDQIARLSVISCSAAAIIDSPQLMHRTRWFSAGHVDFGSHLAGAEGHEFVDFGDDAVLFGIRG